MLSPGRLHARARSVTAIELLVALTVLGILTVVSLPALTAWMSNARVRSAGEQLQNSLRLAQSEALRRNRQTVLALTQQTPALTATPVANGRHWFVRALPALAGETAGDGHYVHGVALPTQLNVAITGPALLCFNSIGRPVANSSTGLGVNCSAPASATAPTRYDITAGGATRPLRVQVFLGGKIRLCDPARTVSASTPDGC